MTSSSARTLSMTALTSNNARSSHFDAASCRRRRTNTMSRSPFSHSRTGIRNYDILISKKHAWKDWWLWRRLEVCPDPSRWNSVVSAYPSWETGVRIYVCFISYYWNLLFQWSILLIMVCRQYLLCPRPVTFNLLHFTALVWSYLILIPSNSGGWRQVIVFGFRQAGLPFAPWVQQTSFKYGMSPYLLNWFLKQSVALCSIF